MPESSPRKLGTFLGVFLPTILTILGVIMYLRTGWVLGHVGLAQMLLIVAIANSITLVTTVSFSAMATNIRLGVGGAYFIISRSLGLGIGAAVGLPLFLSQAVSVTLYAYGLAESIRFVWHGLPMQAATLLIILIVAGISFRGAALALKTQIPLLALVGLSILALAIGAAQSGVHGGLYGPPYERELGFWIGFAIFFPAVTGIMAGLSLSGDLAKPDRSIPMGAILATLSGFAVYLAIPIVLSLAADSELLRTDPMVWSRVAPGGAFLILPGLWGAILSSAVGSMLGAPRTLQALARDQLAATGLGGWFAGERGIRAGMIITVTIGMVAVFLGGLNAVALVVSMFFLTVYGTINLVAALETLSGDPSWRPRLPVPWPVSLAGAAACAWVMFLISPGASLVAIAVEILLWMFFVRRERQASWGDARRGLYEATIRWALVKLADRPMSARNWRPHVLTFVDDPERRLTLVQFGCWFSQDRGVVSVCELVVGDLLHSDVDLVARRRALQQFFDREELTVFAEVDVVEDVVEGITSVSQANGMAGLSSNTILLGWPRDPAKMVQFFETTRRLQRLKKSVVLGRADLDLLPSWAGRRRRVHVWWGGMEQNGDLMLLLAYLLTRNPEWRGAQIRVQSVASNDFAKENTERYLRDLLPELRIDAEVEVIRRPAGATVREVIRSHSKGADVVFFGLSVPKPGEETAQVQRMEELAGDFPAVFFVKNSSLFVGRLVKSEDVEPAAEEHSKSAEPGTARASRSSTRESGA